MVVTEDLRILKWWAISPCIWPDLCNSRIAEIVSDEYSRLELLGLEGIIKFDVLVVEKFAVEHFAIFCVPLGKRCWSVTSYTRFVGAIKTELLRSGEKFHGLIKFRWEMSQESNRPRCLHILKISRKKR